MHVSQIYKDRIKGIETLSLDAYPDSKGWSIGYGHYLGECDLPPVRTITKEQAEAYFDEDVVQREKQVLAFVKAPLTQNQFDALFMAVYNIGIGNAKPIIDQINNGRIDLAVQLWKRTGVHYYDKKLKKWVYSASLQKRRDEEISIFLKK